jgi:hypothetical protein
MMNMEDNKELIIERIANDLVRLTNDYHKIRRNTDNKASDIISSVNSSILEELDNTKFLQIGLKGTPPFGDDKKLKEYFIYHLETRNGVEAIMLYCDYYICDDLFSDFEKHFYDEDKDEIDESSAREQNFYSDNTISEETKTAHRIYREASKIESLICTSLYCN